MRINLWMMGLLGLAGMTARGLVACSTDYADLYAPLTDPKLASGGSGGDGGTSTCEGDPTLDPTIVRDDCGVFVSTSAAPGGDGTKARPFQTFADAAATNTRRVFACAGTYLETKQVTFIGGVEVYGGFTGCAQGWVWSASTQAQITTVADLPGVVLDGGSNRIENVRVTAPSATVAGASSIALLVSGGSLDMKNGALTAGDAKDGNNGVTVPDDPALDGDAGDTGANACDPGASHPGRMGKTKTCATGGSSTAGNGGDGGLLMSMPLPPAGIGSDGSPVDASQPAKGKGGLGEGQLDASMMPAASCDIGQPGANGGHGNSGDGATGSGVLSKDGYAGAAGQDGTNGKPGQGGGGGGAKAATSIVCMTGVPPIDVPGGCGGAGGTGGCGGALGGGGKAGGSSIALLVLDAEVTLASVTLTAGKGGNGGQGGNGQSGGQKGKGGDSGAGKGTAQASCRGGDGGAGGLGGPGGGGQGGHSLGIAFQGKTAPLGGTFEIDVMNNGKGGAGGINNTAASMGKGADGMVADCWDFAANAACK